MEIYNAFAQNAMTQLHPYFRIDFLWPDKSYGYIYTLDNAKITTEDYKINEKYESD